MINLTNFESKNDKKMTKNLLKIDKKRYKGTDTYHIG